MALRRSGGCHGRLRRYIVHLFNALWIQSNFKALHGFRVASQRYIPCACPVRHDSLRSLQLSTPRKVDSKSTTTQGLASKTALSLAKTAAPLSTSSALGDFERIHMAGEEASSFLDSMGVATFKCSGGVWNGQNDGVVSQRTVSGRLENHTPIFCLDDILSPTDCVDIINACEHSGGFRSFQAGKNHHDAMQLLVAQTTVDTISDRLAPFISLEAVEARRRELERREQSLNDNALTNAAPNSPMDSASRLEYAGLNRRWRVYKYAPNAMETFAPHIDAGFPPSGLSDNGDALVYDASSMYLRPDTSDIVSRLTILFYLNDDFEGGETNFYAPQSTSDNSTSTDNECIASVRPVAGSCLLFPQCVGEDFMGYARHYWPLHEGSPVSSGSPKYVIRSDVLFYKVNR